MGLLDIVFADAPRRWRLQRAFNFELLLPDGVSDVPGFEVGKYCQDFEFANYDITELVTVKKGAFHSHHAGLLSIKQMTATFLKPANDIVSKYFTDWRNLIVSPDGFHSVKSKYAKTAYLKLYDRDWTESDSYKLINMFPINMPSFLVSYAEEDIVKMKITFSVDLVESNASSQNKIADILKGGGLNIPTLPSIPGVPKIEDVVKVPKLF